MSIKTYLMIMAPFVAIVVAVFAVARTLRSKPPEEHTFPEDPDSRSAHAAIRKHKTMCRVIYLLTLLLSTFYFVVGFFLIWMAHYSLSRWALTVAYALMVWVVGAAAYTLLRMAKPWNFVRYVFGSSGSWRFAYTWNEAEKRLERRIKPALIERREGMRKVLLFAMCAGLLPAISVGVLGKLEFYHPPYYAEFAQITEYRLDGKWRGYVIWSEGRKADRSCRSVTADYDYCEYYGGWIEGFPNCELPRSNIQRESVARFSQIYNLHWKLRDYVTATDMPRRFGGEGGGPAVDSFEARYGGRYPYPVYTFRFRDLDSGLFAVRDLTAEELAEAGISLQMVNKLLSNGKPEG